MNNQDTSEYGISSTKKSSLVEGPSVDYMPRLPEDLSISIGLIGAGSISEYHLKNYKRAGLNVVAIANRDLQKATAKRDEFFPDASVYSDYNDLLQCDAIKVIDVATHVNHRASIIEACIKSGKHILSQKPLATDLDVADRLIKLAKQHNVLLAVNHNGRWAPHFSYMRNAITSGLIGEVVSINFSLQWDQTWIKGLPSFEAMKHMVLFDFGIHWFDIINVFMQGEKAEGVYALTKSFDSQVYQPPALASAIVSYEKAVATISFNAHTQLGESDVTTIVGTKGTLRSQGPGLNEQAEVMLYKDGIDSCTSLQGSWFQNGFLGTMCELLCALEEGRVPSNDATSALTGLELCFAAIESAETGKAIIPGQIRKVTTI